VIHTLNGLNVLPDDEEGLNMVKRQSVMLLTIAIEPRECGAERAIVEMQ
jgi:hypothetical protein